MELRLAHPASQPNHRDVFSIQLVEYINWCFLSILTVRVFVSFDGFTDGNLIFEGD